MTARNLRIWPALALALALAAGCGDDASRIAEHLERADAYAEEEAWAEAINDLFRTLPVKFIAVPRKGIGRYKRLLRKALRNNACAYVFTSSDPGFLKSAFDDVVYGAYTDAWSVVDGDCTGANCDSY